MGDKDAFGKYWRVYLTLISLYSAAPLSLHLTYCRRLSVGSDTGGDGHLTPPSERILVYPTFILLQDNLGEGAKKKVKKTNKC